MSRLVIELPLSGGVGWSVGAWKLIGSVYGTRCAVCGEESDERGLILEGFLECPQDL